MSGVPHAVCNLTKLLVEGSEGKENNIPRLRWNETEYS